MRNNGHVCFTVKVLCRSEAPVQNVKIDVIQTATRWHILIIFLIYLHFFLYVVKQFSHTVVHFVIYKFFIMLLSFSHKA